MKECLKFELNAMEDNPGLINNIYINNNGQS